MADLYFTEAGDLALSTNGDLATTADFGNIRNNVGYNSYTSTARDYAQQAFIRIMTEIGDYQIYPTLGASLEEQLVGLPNTPETAELGKQIIRNALVRDNSPLAAVPINIDCVPIGPTAMRFDIYLTIGSKTELALSVKQNLDTTFALPEGTI